MSSHRKARSSNHPLTRQALRVGLLAAGFAGVATAVPAQAATGAAHAAYASDHVFTHADRAHHTRTQDSFTVRQFGTADAAGVRNQANAVSAGCSADDHCRSVALSFQIVTVAGEHTHLNASNYSDAANKECTGCQTLAGAYQFVVSTPTAFGLDAATRQHLDDIHQRLDALTRSTLPAAELKARVDGLAGEVSTVLRDAVAHAPKADAEPTVTLHRHLDGWPGH
ncbi:hypothetical protein GCM10010260_26650 [Streptomyces filipinensis]|uniref:Uncharacterized protein n=1 Tax=Streptomyces filipinensis TaxID=66887 RepID=A0A918M9Y8_9ACTN|nr:hypothetical protein [Streptomyces filipinensis]GGU90763.1 hypothetical protein GCM10010260_26650 [Streptomyces filipinensis]